MNNYLCRADYLRIDASFGRLVRVNGGLVKSAEVASVSKTLLQRYTSSTKGNEVYSAPSRIVAELQAACGQTIVTDEIAIISRENSLQARHSPGDPLDRVMSAIKETEEACEEYVRFVRSHRTANDAKKALKEIDEAVEVLRAKRRDVLELQTESSVVSLRKEGPVK